MGKIFTKLRSIPMRNYALLAVLVSVIAIPAALWAWGPDRPTYTIEKPATKVTFNSITNNPHIGDERNFVGIREDGTNGKWQDNQRVERGKQYVVRMYVHNNAAANLNLVANNVTAKFRVPTNSANSLQVNGFLSASNATPREVYDHATFSASEDFNLAVVPGSVKYYNNASTFTIPESVFTASGAKLGYSKMDGNIPGCFQYAGYLTFIVKPQFAPKHDFTMEKKVSKHGANKWSDTYQAQPGETVDFLIKYKNTGEVQQNNVTFRDKLPAGLTYVASSTVLGNSKTPKGAKVSDNLTTAAGINVGSYAKGANAWVIFSAKVAGKEQLVCGANSLRNVAAVIPEGAGQKEDDATVTVTKDCPPAPQPKNITVCRLSDKKIVTIKESQFDSTKHSKNLDDCKEAPKQIKVCVITTGVISTINETDFDANKHTKDLTKCDDMKVCELSTGTIITIKKPAFDSKKHGDESQCEKVQRCFIPAKRIVEIARKDITDQHTDDLSKCAPAPVTPPTPPAAHELPRTGADLWLQGLGIGTLVTVSAAYIASRRTLG